MGGYINVQLECIRDGVIEERRSIEALFDAIKHFQRTGLPIYSCEQGTLITLSHSPVSCGVVGSAVGSGVLWNFEIENAAVTINGNAYSGSWILPLAVY